MKPLVMAVLALLLCVPAAVAQDGVRERILNDCVDDDILQGDYSATDLRDARNHQTAQQLEYSSCQDVLTRAIADKTAKPAATGTPAPVVTSAPTGATPTPTPTATPEDTGRQLPQTPQEWHAIGEAQRQGPALTRGIRQLSPGAKLTATVGRNALPGTLVGVLALLAAAAVAPALTRKR
jgi:hypothetical protein